MQPKTEQPKQYTLEEIAELEKSRTISDAELLKGGRYSFNEEGEKILNPTKEQIEKIHKKLEADLKEGGIEQNQENAKFISDAIRNKEAFFENEANKEKFDKFFIEMNERLSQIDKLVDDLEDSEIRSKFEEKVGTLKEALSGKLKKRVGESGYCCLSDSYFGYLDPDSVPKEIWEDTNNIPLGTLVYRRSEAGNDLSNAVDRIALEVFRIVVQERKYGSAQDMNYLMPLLGQIAEKLGVSSKQAMQGVINRMKTQRIDYNDQTGEIKVVENK